MGESNARGVAKVARTDFSKKSETFSGVPRELMKESKRPSTTCRIEKGYKNFVSYQCKTQQASEDHAMRDGFVTY